MIIRLLQCGFICFLCLMYSCVSNVEEILYPIETCDTTAVTYSQTIAPIIAHNCFACHGGAATISGIPLEGFTNLKTKVTQGRLLGAVRRLQGFSPMPQNAPSLPECDLLKIEKWIEEGALDN